MPAAETYLKKIKDKALKKKYSDTIVAIRTDPSIGTPKTGDLTGYFGYDIHYNKTNYELAYCLSENEAGEIVIIVMAGTRENFYQALKRYIR